MTATRGFLTAVECTKSVFGRSFVPDPAGEFTTLPQTPSRLGTGDTPPHSPLPSTRSASRSRRLRRLVPKTPSDFFSLDTALDFAARTLKRIYVTPAQSPLRVLTWTRSIYAPRQAFSGMSAHRSAPGRNAAPASRSPAPWSALQGWKKFF